MKKTISLGSRIQGQGQRKKTIRDAMVTNGGKGLGNPIDGRWIRFFDSEEDYDNCEAMKG